MTQQTTLWEVMLAAQGAVVQQLGPAVRAAMEDNPLSGVQGWFQLGLACTIRPEPLTVKRMQVRNPYTYTTVLATHVQNLRDANFLDETGVITQEAYDAYQALVDAQDDCAKSLNLLPADKLNTVNQLLENILAEIDDSQFPVLHDTAKEELKDDPVHRFYDVVSHFRAYRDDVHLNAWRPTGIDGHTHEAFSLIWDGSADSVTTLMEIRGLRGYDADDWQATLNQLVKKGWLSQSDDTYHATDEGSAARQKIEDETNATFYAPFNVLSEDETEQLIALLKEIETAFTPEPQKA